MYGHIHVILKDLVLNAAGAVEWHRILDAAGLAGPGDEARILETVMQRDEVTDSLVRATCKVLGLTAEQALTAFGRHFVVFALRSGNACFLRAHGATLPVFLANVNSLHNHLERDHPNARFPFLEAKYDHVNEEVLLTYLSSREGFSSLVVGIIEEIGRRIYGVDVTMVPAEVPAELREAKSLDRAAAWTLRWTPRPGGPEPLEPQVSRGMSFSDLHCAMVDFGRLLRRAHRWTPFSACRTSAAAGAALELCVDGEEYEGLPKGRSIASILKEKALRERGCAAPESILMRGVRARNIAASWSDASLTECRPFWESATGRIEDFELSEDVKRADVFVSHSWSAPANWAEVMGADARHADVKSTTLAIMAKDLALAKGRLDTWGSVTLWVDKACIPQDNAKLKDQCIGLLERFVAHCDYVCVVFTWSYLERLWCVFEWACFLKDKEPSQVYLQNEFFVKEETLPLYLDNVRYFSLHRAECSLESDRAILIKKISACYVSTKAFEQLVQATVVALMARSMAYRGGRSAHLRNTFFQPWVDLAEELGFTRIAEALKSCRLLEWRSEAAYSPQPPAARGVAVRAEPVLLGSAATQMGVSASKYQGRINRWFDSAVSPALREIRDRAVHE
mmetsp:Transcript_15377/g.44034  ORF Transcript_15377/g.44034 Transcript_15377/m.44034 type:complete len:624 (+) Transcript_15377:66-1937(+)